MSKYSSDFVVVGAGIAGISFLKHLKKRGHSAILLEKAESAGGLWRDVPPWQDIQTRAQDWAINGTPIAGVEQKHILANIEALIERHKLEKYIRYHCPVQGAQETKTGWIVQTPSGQFECKHLIVATGAHNVPRLPHFKRTNPQAEEYHAFTLRNPDFLRLKRVTILGGGASAYDLLDLALDRGASEIHWVYRTLNWMIPTTQPKHEKGGMRDLALRQMRGSSAAQINAVFNDVLSKKYDFFKISEIRPREPFDIEKHQIIPGRPLMIKKFAQIQRHEGTINELNGKTISCDSKKWETDILVHATGYELNLSYLGLPKLENIHSIEDLQKRCGSYVISLDYKNLYFLVPTLLNTSSTAPFLCAIMSKSLLSHIEGKISLPLEPITKKINHWHMFDFLAKHDRKNYKPWWRTKYRVLAELYSRFPNLQLRA